MSKTHENTHQSCLFLSTSDSALVPPSGALVQVLRCLIDNLHRLQHPVYLVGSSHPHKTDAQQMLEQAVSANERLVTDAEVLQEIVHRYAAIDRRDAI